MFIGQKTVTKLLCIFWDLYSSDDWFYFTVSLFCEGKYYYFFIPRIKVSVCQEGEYFDRSTCIQIHAKHTKPLRHTQRCLLSVTLSYTHKCTHTQTQTHTLSLHIVEMDEYAVTDSWFIGPAATIYSNAALRKVKNLEREIRTFAFRLQE